MLFGMPGNFGDGNQSSGHTPVIDLPLPFPVGFACFIIIRSAIISSGLI